MWWTWALLPTRVVQRAVLAVPVVPAAGADPDAALRLPPIEPRQVALGAAVIVVSLLLARLLRVGMRWWLRRSACGGPACAVRYRARSVGAAGSGMSPWARAQVDQARQSPA